MPISERRAGSRSRPANPAFLAPAKLTPDDLGRLMKHGRRLRREGELTAHDFALLDCMLFQCRALGSAVVRFGYQGLATLAGIGRSSVRKGLARLQAAGLFTRHRHRLRFAWHQGGTASRMAVNTYEFHARHTEVARQPENKTQESTTLLEAPPGLVQAAQEGLADIAARRQAQRAAAWQTRRR